MRRSIDWRRSAGYGSCRGARRLRCSLVPSGMPDHASGGDVFLPRNLGLRCLSARAFYNRQGDVVRDLRRGKRPNIRLGRAERQDQPGSKHQSRETAIHWLAPTLAMKGVAPASGGVLPVVFYNFIQRWST